MNGKEVYEDRYRIKTENVINNNPDKPYLKGFYNYMSSSRLSCSTKYDYVNYVVAFMNTNRKNVEDLELDDYTEFLTGLNNMTSSYQISVYSGLKKFATYLVASRKTAYNPMEQIARPKHKEKEETIAKRENGYLEKKEIGKYISAVKSGTGTSRAIARQEQWKERDLLIILIFLSTGMRCSALYKLDLSSIDLQNKTLTANDKGDNVKTYILSDNVINSVCDWLNKREQILDGIEENALFISNQRTRMDQSTIYRVVNKYAKGIKDKHISPHKLRATYGTQLLEETRDIYFVQKCMGHSNPATTELYIRGQSKNNESRACDIMSKIIK